MLKKYLKLKLKKKIKQWRTIYLLYRERKLEKHEQNFYIVTNENHYLDIIAVFFCIYLTSYECILFEFLRIFGDFICLLMPNSSKGFGRKLFNKAVYLTPHFGYALEERIPLRTGLRYFPLGVSVFYFLITKVFLAYMTMLGLSHIKKDLLYEYISALTKHSDFELISVLKAKKPESLELQIERDFFSADFNVIDMTEVASKRDLWVAKYLSEEYGIELYEKSVKPDTYVGVGLNPSASLYIGILFLLFLFMLITILATKYAIWFIFSLYSWVFYYYYNVGEIMAWTSTDAEFVKKKESQDFYTKEILLSSYRISEKERTKMIKEHPDDFEGKDFSAPLAFDPESPEFEAWSKRWIILPLQKFFVGIYEIVAWGVQLGMEKLPILLFKKLHPLILHSYIQSINQFYLFVLHSVFLKKIESFFFRNSQRKIVNFISKEHRYFEFKLTTFFEFINRSSIRIGKAYLQIETEMIAQKVDDFMKALFLTLTFRQYAEDQALDPEVREAALQLKYDRTRADPKQEYTDEENEAFEISETDPEDHRAQLQPLIFVNFYFSIVAYTLSLFFIFFGVDRYLNAVSFIHGNDFDLFMLFLFWTWWLDFFRGDGYLYQTWFYAGDIWFDNVRLYDIEDELHDFDYEEAPYSKYHNDYSDLMTEDFDWNWPNEADFEMWDCYNDLGPMNWQYEIYDVRPAEYLVEYYETIWYIKNWFWNLRSQVEREIVFIFSLFNMYIFKPLFTQIAPYLELVYLTYQPFFDSLSEFLRPLKQFLIKYLKKLVINKTLFFPSEHLPIPKPKELPPISSAIPKPPTPAVQKKKPGFILTYFNIFGRPV